MNRRVAVLGGTCTGKTTLVQSIIGSLDMDLLVFPKLTKEEHDYVCQRPWTPEIGRTMSTLTRKHVSIQPGHPVFGRVLLPCDLIVHLRISEILLKERVKKRNADFDDAKNMHRYIEQEINRSEIRVVGFVVG